MKVTLMTDYDELARRAERGELAVVPGTVKRGAAAVADANDMLLTATGAATIDEAATLALGRPRLDAATTEGRTWKVRTTTALDDEVRRVAAERHVSVSQLVREAVASYVHAH